MNVDTTFDPLITADIRLAALDAHGILNTPVEAAYDDIVRLATRLPEMIHAVAEIVGTTSM